MSKNTNVENFIRYVESECKKHGVKVKEYKRRYIKLTDNVKCAGFFDDNTKPPTLAYAKGREDYLELLVHEYCHMTQWLDKIPLWGIASKSNYIIGEWLNGTEYSDIANHIAIARNLELDNEIRASEMIEDYDLGVTKSEYIKTANAYIVYYNYLLISRKWSEPKNSPYGNKKIVAAMSDKFDMNYESLDRDLYDLFKSENI